MSEPEGHVDVPTTPDLEQTAWEMLYAEGGVLAVALTIGLVILWKVVARNLVDGREQTATLIKAQTEGLRAQADSMTALTKAVAEMDVHNQVGLAKLSDAQAYTQSRLDKVENIAGDLVTGHHAMDRRVTLLEHGAGHSGVRQQVKRIMGDKD